MRLCLIASEFYGVGFIGGFGLATRAIGRELAACGHDVTVIVPRRANDGPAELRIDGMTLWQFAPARPRQAIAMFKECRADLFHSQDPSFATWLAMRAAPHTPHIVTFLDPMEDADWRIEAAHNDRLVLAKYRLFIDNPLVRRAVRRARGLYCAAPFLVPKVARKYRLPRAPAFLPTPVAVPETVTKAAEPTVCFVGRWHRRKRPELFFEMAQRFPDVRFIAVGGDQDTARDRDLRRTYGSIPNLTLTGVIDQFSSDRLSRVLAESWILINTAEREGLPNAYLEAAAHRAAILSCVHVPPFTGTFGVQAAPENLDDGLRHLLEGDRWRAMGAAGWEHVSQTFETRRAIDAHLDSYRRALNGETEFSLGEGQR